MGISWVSIFPGKMPVT